MRGWLLTRHLFVFAAGLALTVLAVAAAGCEKGSLGGDMPPTTGAGGSSASPTCAAVTGADGAVCKQCIDATGAVVYDSCASAPTVAGSAGTTGGGGTGMAGAAGTGGAAGGSGGGACIQISDGGPTSCKDSATWKMYGTAACAERNLTLADISWDISCSPDHYQQVTYVCCGGCTRTVDATGLACTTCTDATGKIISAECHGDGGTGATEICDVRTIADGSPCKVCWEPDGSMSSTCPPPHPTTE
ncbi:MAG TPA: hypothetical protein VIF57_12085 [Polyangia bacterium]